MKMFVNLLIIILSLVCFFVGVSFFDGYFGERVYDYIKQETTNVTTEIIEKSIREDVLSNIDVNDILIINDSGIIVNTKTVNKILANVSDTLVKCQEKLESIETLKLPMGIVFSEILLNYGPEINVKMYQVGSFKTDVVSQVEEYGINNSLFKLEINVQVTVVTLIPLNKQEIMINSRIPIVTQIVKGEVPKYYSYGFNDVLVKGE